MTAPAVPLRLFDETAPESSTSALVSRSTSFTGRFEAPTAKLAAGSLAKSLKEFDQPLPEAVGRQLVLKGEYGSSSSRLNAVFPPISDDAGRYFVRADDAAGAGLQVGKPAARQPTPAPSPEWLASLKALAKHMEHMQYLARVSTGERTPITPETAELARNAWFQIWKASGSRISVPAACTGPDGEMFYSWDRGRHHLELEIIPGEPAEFFYRDRETEDYLGVDYTVGQPLPSGIAAKLGLFY